VLEPLLDPKHSRGGRVSSPVLMVAPISVNAGNSSVTTRAPAPWPTVIGSARSFIVVLDVSSSARGSRRISSTKNAPPAARAPC